MELQELEMQLEERLLALEEQLRSMHESPPYRQQNFMVGIVFGHCLKHLVSIKNVQLLSTKQGHDISLIVSTQRDTNFLLPDRKRPCLGLISLKMQFLFN